MAFAWPQAAVCCAALFLVLAGKIKKALNFPGSPLKLPVS
jgi:hypothetical protein